MPEQPPSKRRPLLDAPAIRSVGPRYAELHAKTNFSFLEGASHPDELVNRAAELGYHALAVTDRQSLAGVVRAHAAAKAAGLKLLIGAEVLPDDAPAAVLLATDRASYGRLSKLLTVGRRRAAKGQCELAFDDVAAHAEGLLACVLGGNARALADYREIFGDRCYALAELHRGPDDRRQLAERIAAARRARVPAAAANDVRYHAPQRRRLEDVLTAIRAGTTVAEAGERLFANAERYLKPLEELSLLFADAPELLRRTVEIADRTAFSLDELRYEYPEELCPAGTTPAEHLARLAWKGAQQRYPGGVPEKVRRLIEHELQLIGELRYEAFFLTVWDLVRFARSRGILCQGRGSAANSAVCYCLGVTSVDPERMDVLFERFISRERNEAPDIDVDFEHERREEVLQYVYEKYGRERAGLAAEVITYRPRSAVRDVGKALGFAPERLDALAKLVDGRSDAPLEERLCEAGFDPAAAEVQRLASLVRELIGFPRHLSQHVGGMVITQGPLSELTPIENAAMPGRTVIQWDKDDLDELGILKVDCLALGMLTAIRKCFQLIERHAGRRLTLANTPQEDPDVYAMISRADTMGVFQIESRAQMSMLPRLRPKTFYDLVIEVAIIRPGPIQGNMVHPYLRRRNKEETVTYPNDEIRRVLEKTLGVPIFQEQAMKLAVVAAGFTPGEADQLRRAMGGWRRPGLIDEFRQKLLAGMVRRGLPQEYAERVFEQIRGFGEYGFPESHSASFALLAYVSAWLKHHYPAAFTAALLNSQPMGFYASAQLVRDLQQHGVEVRPVDVNHSDQDCTLEAALADGPAEYRPAECSDARWALRLGFR
ncbi:MAG TPA: error-prone DNA polymerase, partial [Pirellulales bacterium]|nr:error-prone DNA polymerase [Pirellulales bacterium]